MKQHMAVFDAKGPDNDVGCLSNCDPEVAELSIIASGGHGQRVVQQRDHRIASQIALDSRGMKIISCALQDFEQNDIADQKRLSHRSRLQLGSRGGVATPEMRYPN